jgi:hypothetical protein
MRLVGCGVKVRYAGTVLALAGRCTTFRAPANRGFTSGTIADLLAIPTTRKNEMKRVYRSVTYVPDDPDFLGYSTAVELNTASPVNQPVLIHVIDGAPPNTSFDYEVSAYWEMIGSTNVDTQSTFTKSHSDVTAMGAAIASLPVKIPGSSPEIQEQKGLMDLGNEILNTASHIAYNFGSSILKNYTNAYAAQPQQYQALKAGPTVEEVDY